MNTNIELTQPLKERVLASVRAGGYVHVAMTAWAVTPERWKQWQRWGAEPDGPAPYKAFCREVEQASAQARLRAEMATLEEDPRTWLKHGPGKERPGQPGWSALASHAPEADQQDFDFFGCLPGLRLLDALRTVLASDPKILAAVSGLLLSFDRRLVLVEPLTAAPAKKGSAGEDPEKDLDD